MTLHRGVLKPDRGMQKPGLTRCKLRRKVNRSEHIENQSKDDVAEARVLAASIRALRAVLIT